MSKTLYFKESSLAYKNGLISNNSVKHKNEVWMLEQFYFKQFSLAQVHSLVLFNPLIGPN